MKMRKIIALMMAVLMLCSILPLAALAEGEATTVTVSVADYANANTWSNDKQYSTMQLDSVIKATASGSQNTGKYYSSDGSWRLYETEKATLKIEAAEATIISVKVSYSVSKSGALMNGTTKLTSGSVISVNADAITLSVEQSSDGNNGQVRINEIEVVYTTGTTTGGGEEPVPETPTDPEADSVLTIEEAIALGNTKSKDEYTEGKYYVTGVIKSVYNAQYGNMYIQDEAGNELCIYGTYSADGSTRYDAMEVKPVAGDTITVYGVIGKYNDPQMKNGWIVEHIPAVNECEHTNVADYVCTDCGAAVPPAADSVLTLPQATALGAALKGAYTEGKYYVTGVIKNVYNTQYGNMYITDEDGNELCIYGTYSADGELRYDAMEVKPVAGDTVTIYGVIGSYNGTSQMKNGWIVEHTPGEGDEEEETTPDPEADTELTIEEANALGTTKEHNTYTEGKYYVTGVITEIYSDVYGNMYITDEAGNVLNVYGTYSADGELRYDAMEVKPAVGDTVTVYGVIGQYNGKPQMKNGWIVEHIPADTGDDGSDNTGDSEEDTSAGTGDFGIIAAAAVMLMSGSAVALLKKKEF